MRARTVYGTDAKTRTGEGWGGKMSHHRGAIRRAAVWALKNGWGAPDPVRRYVPYEPRRGSGATRFAKVQGVIKVRVERIHALPHQGTMERLRRKAGGTRALREQLEA